MMNIKQSLFVILSTLTLSAYAAPTHWQIIPNESSLTFTATQNGAPATGSFKQFTGDILFDPDDVTNSKVTIIVTISSLSSSYQDMTSTLLMPDWLNAKLFPKATFNSTKFTKIDDTHFKADGMLTIRDKTLPVTLNFMQEEKTVDHAKVKGNTTLKRNAFGVGQGEWSSGNEIKDNVDVNFTLSVIKVR